MICQQVKKRALMIQLRRLMMHIIKWQIQPQKRSASWVSCIVQSRDEIEDIKNEKP